MICPCSNLDIFFLINEHVNMQPYVTNTTILSPDLTTSPLSKTFSQPWDFHSPHFDNDDDGGPHFPAPSRGSSPTHSFPSFMTAVDTSWCSTYHPGTTVNPQLGGGLSYPEDPMASLFADSPTNIDSFHPTHPVSQSGGQRKTPSGGTIASSNVYIESESQWQKAIEIVDSAISVDRRSTGMHDLGVWSVTEEQGGPGPIKIPLDDETVRIFVKPRRKSPAEEEVTTQKVKPLEDNHIITEAPYDCKYAADNVIAAKKDEHGKYSGDVRFCQNFKPINKHQKLDRTTVLPLAVDLHECVGKSKFFSKIDLRSGFMQIPIAEEDQPKTAFWFGKRLMMYRYMPFGMKNSPVEFQKRMDFMIRKCRLSAFACCFIDDIMVYSESFEDHCQHLLQVFEALKQVGLKYHSEKSVFFADEIEYLGHMVSSHGLSPTQARVEAIRVLTPPKNVSELRTRLGVMVYYSCYYAAYAQTARPLYDLLKKDAVWQWGDKEQEAFDTLKKETSTEGKALKRPDPSRPFILHTDWSKEGMAGILGQIDDNQSEYIVACASRSLIPAEVEYGSYRGEMLAAVWAVRIFRPYLWGRMFTLVTDHQPLQWLMTSPNLVGQYARWSLILQEFDFVIIHRPGAKHQNADALSRCPHPSTSDTTGARADYVQHQSAAVSTATLTSIFHDVSFITSILSQDPLHEFQPVSLLSDFEVAVQNLSDSRRPYLDYIHLGHDIDDNSITPYHGGEDSDFSFFGRPFSEEEEAAEPVLISSHQLNLQERAKSWVDQVYPFSRVKPVPTQSLVLDQSGMVSTIATHPIAPAVIQTMLSEGVTLFEPFGGLSSGLEALLRNNVPIRRYIYSDTSVAARSVALHRIHTLQRQYGHRLLPPSAFARAFDTLPQNVYCITSSQLSQAVNGESSCWMVVAGWECQDLSPAGPRLGLDGPRSRSFFPLSQILGHLQSLLPRKVIYIIENTAMQCHPGKPQDDFSKICAVLGPPLLLDAAQFGAGAARLRNFWTNMAPHALLSATLQVASPPPNSGIHLLPGRRTQICRHRTPPPYYPINIPGQPLKVLPTIVAFAGSHAYRGQGMGKVFDDGQMDDGLHDLYIEEREMALGYDPGSTAAIHLLTGQPLSPMARHVIIGSCIDASTLQSIIAVSLQLQRLLFPSPTTHAMCTAPATGGEYPAEFSEESFSFAGCLYTPHPPDLYLLALSTAAEQEEARLPDVRIPDVWEDKVCMEIIQDGAFTDETISKTSPVTRRQAMRRSRAYKYHEGRVWRQLSHDLWREVPPPGDRLAIIRDIHESMGHFGRTRTTDLVLQRYWWAGLYSNVRAYVLNCPQCSRVTAEFRTHQPHLNPLPIMGPHFRWHMDMAGKFPASRRGYIYITVAVEAWTKFAIISPMRSKESQENGEFVSTRIIAVFGAPAVILTDGGQEFQGDFLRILAQSFIHHRKTSPNHPQTNGLAERMVETIKNSLKKILSNQVSFDDWDELIPRIQMGYNSSVQNTTKLSPYELMFGSKPGIPSSIREKMAAQLPMEWLTQDEGADNLAAFLNAKQKLIAANAISAGQNMAIQQHRDTLRYATIRGESSGLGGYTPQLLTFSPGDYVRPSYLTTDGKGPNSFTPRAREEILRVLSVRRSGVLLLQGRDGRTITENAVRCTPCHLPIGESGPLPILEKAGAPSQSCQVCRFPHDESRMVLCDSCDRGWHLYCLTPPLTIIPTGLWFCPQCLEAGVDSSTGVIPQQPLLPTPQSYDELAGQSLPPLANTILEPTSPQVQRRRNLSRKKVQGLNT